MCKLRWTCYERWGKECERCGINIGKLASRLCNSAQEKARYYTDRIGTSLFLKRFEFSSIVAAVSSSFALVHRLKVMVMGVQQRAFIYQVERFFYYFCIDPVMRFDFFFFFFLFIIFEHFTDVNDRYLRWIINSWKIYFHSLFLM